MQLAERGPRPRKRGIESEIRTALPLALGGAFVGLLIALKSSSMPSQIGLVMLMGPGQPEGAAEAAVSPLSNGAFHSNGYQKMCFEAIVYFLCKSYAKHEA